MTAAKWTAIFLLTTQSVWAQQAAPLPPAPPATSSQSGLPPGRAAGVPRARQLSSGLLLTGVAGLIAGVAVLASGGGGSTAKPQSQSVTTSTP
jgi:hypothetical protein